MTAAARAQPAASFAFDDPDAFRDGPPYHLLARLRGERDVVWMPPTPRTPSGYWAVLRHRDIVRVSRSPAEFMAGEGTLLYDLPPHALRRGALAMLSGQLGFRDPPDHTKLRQLLAPPFLPAAVRTLEQGVREVVRELVKGIENRPSFDLVADFALPLPVRVVLGVVMGMDPAMGSRVVQLMLRAQAPEDPKLNPEGPLGAIEALDQVYRLGQACIRERRAAPNGDMVSALLASRFSDGTPADDQTVLELWFALLAGAFETVTGTVAGGTLALLENPDQLQRLREDPSLFPTAVDEILRWVAPVLYFRRTAVRDAEIGGAKIRAGQKLLLCYPSGNRDPQVFADPERFDVGRTPNAHLTFGYGPHFCLGARLAELQLRVAFQELVPLLDRLRLSGPIQRVRSSWLNRITALPVRRSA
jgi:cholest-4-en-3-one 26-monooxygenase